MKRRFTPLATLLAAGLLTASATFAQETQTATDPESLNQRLSTVEDAVAKQSKFKVSGYIQFQYQWAEYGANVKAGGLKVGGGLHKQGHDYDRIGIRRGRIKFAYDEGIFGGVFQLDISDKGGVTFKDAYLSVKDPWVGTNTLKAGVFDRPFGFEISYSSSRRESPERSTIFQTLFPDERDLGAAFTLQPSKTSPWNFLKLEGGLFAGNGINREIDNKRDFIGHLSLSKALTGDLKLSGGFSYYNGGVIQNNANVYTMEGTSFVLNDDTSNQFRYAKREYFGLDLQFALNSALGMTQLRGEYLWGTQPGGILSTKSPGGFNAITGIANVNAGGDTYIRNFSGGYAILVQDFGKLPLSGIVKYDWYDPNTKISKNQIAAAGSGTGYADLAQSTLGLGLLWRLSPAFRVTAYYEISSNEKTDNLSDVTLSTIHYDFSKNLKDNIFTFRIQYKF